MLSLSKNLTPFALVLLLVMQAGADQMDVSKWEVYRAIAQPQFRMAFPGQVDDRESDGGHTYSSHARPAEDLALQVIVHATRRSQSAADVEPEEALKIFTDNAEGNVTSKDFERDGTSFILNYTSDESEEGLVVISLHQVYFLGYNVYDVSCTVIAEESVGRQRLDDALDIGRAALKRFQAG